MSNFAEKMTRNLGKVKLWGIKRSPELFLIAGIGAGALCIFEACKGTLKAESIIDEHREMVDKIHEAKEIAEEGTYTEKDVKKDLVKAYAKTGVKFAKTYAPAVIFGALSLTCILTSHGIMRKRNLALAASVATLRKAFDDYRGRVVRDLGSDMDNHFMYDTVEKTIEHEVTDEETGKTKKVKEKIQVPTCGGAYSRFFDESNPNFEKDGASNYIFVRAQMLTLQRRLIRDGYLFLNDAYKALDIPISLAGQSAGWVYDYDNRDNTMVFFEGFDIDGNERNLSDEVRAFKNGYERNCLIKFANVRDNILDDLQRVDSSIEKI